MNCNWDKIGWPYSTLLALTPVSAAGLYLIFFTHLELLGMGMIIGGLAAILLKSAAEVSDRELWQHIRGLFGRKNKK